MRLFFEIIQNILPEQKFEVSRRVLNGQKRYENWERHKSIENRIAPILLGDV
jgi:hypothetical protein